jgi:hypothetical protein
MAGPGRLPAAGPPARARRPALPRRPGPRRAWPGGLRVAWLPRSRRLPRPRGAATRAGLPWAGWPAGRAGRAARLPRSAGLPHGRRVCWAPGTVRGVPGVAAARRARRLSRSRRVWRDGQRRRLRVRHPSRRPRRAAFPARPAGSGPGRVVSGRPWNGARSHGGLRSAVHGWLCRSWGVSRIRAGRPRPRDYLRYGRRRMAGQGGRAPGSREHRGPFYGARADGPRGSGRRHGARDPSGYRDPGRTDAQAGGRARDRPRARLRPR